MKKVIIKRYLVIPVLLAIVITSLSLFISPNVVNAYQRINVESFVTRLYTVTLGREPDANGLASWSNSLINGENTGVSVAYGFIMSPEFQNKEYTNEQYIELMYQAFFGRQSDRGGMNSWLDRMNNGLSKEELFSGFANSNEFFSLCNGYGVIAGTYMIGKNYQEVAKTNLFVQRLYNVILGRSCDRAGMESWTTQLINGTITGAEAAYGFVFSDEYRNQNKTDSEFVSDLYLAFLGRSADSNGMNDWISRIRNGASDVDIFNGFTQSAEFDDICSSYGIVRGTAITSSVTARGQSSTQPVNPQIVPGMPQYGIDIQNAREYIQNVNNGTIHHSGCRTLPRPENRRIVYISDADLENYHCCGNCF